MALVHSPWAPHQKDPNRSKRVTIVLVAIPTTLRRAANAQWPSPAHMRLVLRGRLSDRSLCRAVVLSDTKQMLDIFDGSHQ